MALAFFFFSAIAVLDASTVVLLGVISLFDRAAGFLPPRPHAIAIDARRRCQGWSRSDHRRLGLYIGEHDSMLDPSGLGLLACFFGRGVMGRFTSMSMARAMIASAYIRQLRSGLPHCCMHG